MATTTITINVWGEKTEMVADWAEASSPIMIDGDSQPMRGQQVADFSHRPESAIRWYLAEIAESSGDDPTDPEIVKEIEKLVEDSLASVV